MNLTELNIYFRDIANISNHVSGIVLNACLSVAYVISLIAFTLWLFRVVFRYWNYEPVTTSITDDLRRELIKSHQDILDKRDKRPVAIVGKANG